MTIYTLVCILIFLIVILIVNSINNSLGSNFSFKRKENLWILSGTIIGILGLSFPLIILLIVGEKINIDLFNKLGTLGDFLGGTMVGLLSFSSILFVTAAVVMQKEELKLQREELLKTRQEFELTNSTMKKQAFDSTFFNLISLQNEILLEIKINNRSGREAIEYLLEEFNKDTEKKVNNVFLKSINTLDINQKIYVLEEILQDFQFDTNQNEEFERHLLDAYHVKNSSNKAKSSQSFNQFFYEVFMKYNYYIYHILKIDIGDIDFKWESSIYEEFYRKYDNKLSHYYRNLYSILKYVFNADINNNEKTGYLEILKAQLSKSEFAMLFYYTNYLTSKNEFYLLFIEYGVNFFEGNLNNEDLILTSNKI